MSREEDAKREMHKATYRFWQTQIKKAKECYISSTPEIKMFWERRIENANDGCHKIVEGIRREYGSEYLDEVTQPEWFDFLDMLCP